MYVDGSWNGEHRTWGAGCVVAGQTEGEYGAGGWIASDTYCDCSIAEAYSILLGLRVSVHFYSKNGYRALVVVTDKTSIFSNMLRRDASDTINLGGF